MLLQYWFKSQMEQDRNSDRASQPTSRCPWKHWYWPSQQCCGENKLPCGAQMSKELSSLAPLSVNRPPACNYLQVCVYPWAEFSKAFPVPNFYSHLLFLSHRQSNEQNLAKLIKIKTMTCKSVTWSTLINTHLHKMEQKISTRVQSNIIKLSWNQTHFVD